MKIWTTYHNVSSNVKLRCVRSTTAVQLSPACATYEATIWNYSRLKRSIFEPRIGDQREIAMKFYRCPVTDLRGAVHLFPSLPPPLRPPRMIPTRPV